MSRVFLIHGFGGHPSGGWKPWAKGALEAQGFEVISPLMPATNHPRAEAWVAEIERLVGKPRPDDSFIGHSLGCIAIVRYLESLPPGERVKRCVFVAGFYEELGPEYDELKSFVDHPVAWERVKAACAEFAVLHSDDDDSVPVRQGRDLADRLGVPLELHTGYGHFSGGDGVTELPLVLRHFT